MPLAPMPEDLKARVAEGNELLRTFERRLAELETTAKNAETFTTGVKELRHDFNNVRSVIVALMTEIDQRDPVPPRKAK
jgi:hypothetical protein